jgi:hypothetical protein
VITCTTLCRGLALTAMLVHLGPAQTDQPTDQKASIESWLRMEMLQSDPDARLPLLERLLSHYQKSGLALWAYEQVCDGVDASKIDATLALGEKLMALDPQDIEIAERSLKLADQKKDPALTKKWSGIVSRSADSLLAMPANGEAGKKRMEIARSIGSNLEIRSYSEILQTSDPVQKQARIEKFLDQYKQSCYRSVLEDLYLEAANVLGGSARTLTAAKKILEWDDHNAVALMVIAETQLRAGREPSKLRDSAARILTLLDQQGKPEGLTAQQWSKKRGVLSGRAHWMIGRAYMQEDRYREADNSLRTALPYLKGDSQLSSDALFYLAWANYQLHNYADAMRFNSECTRIDGPYRAQAAKNLEVFRAENGNRPSQLTEVVKPAR